MFIFPFPQVAEVAVFSSDMLNLPSSIASYLYKTMKPVSIGNIRKLGFSNTILKSLGLFHDGTQRSLLDNFCNYTLQVYSKFIHATLPVQHCLCAYSVCSLTNSVTQSSLLIFNNTT